MSKFKSVLLFVLGMYFFFFFIDFVVVLNSNNAKPACEKIIKMFDERPAMMLMLAPGMVGGCIGK